MTYSIRIEGLDRIEKLLGQDFGSAIQAASEEMAQEIEGKLLPAPGGYVMECLPDRDDTVDFLRLWCKVFAVVQRREGAIIGFAEAFRLTRLILRMNK